ncbi:MAG: hypothetical protein V2I26_07845 [Halieaceae bacterium]|nr:hypothetical protein [Halieaceae bacterium]
MLDLVTEAINALQEETTTYPQNVQIWMKLMGVSFLASIVFVRSKAGARWVLAALLLNILGLVAGKMLFPDQSRTSIGTYVHILFWPAILWAVWRSFEHLSFSREANSLYDWAYIAWLGWASILMFISLVFDFRTLISMWI